MPGAVAVDLDEVVTMVRENERMRMALMAIQTKAREAVMGAWRGEINALATEGLRRDVDHEKLRKK